MLLRDKASLEAELNATNTRSADLTMEVTGPTFQPTSFLLLHPFCQHLSTPHHPRPSPRPPLLTADYCRSWQLRHLASQHEELSAKLEEEQSARATADMASIHARAEAAAFVGTLNTARAEASALTSELRQSEVAVDELRRAKEALHEQTNTLAHQVSQTDTLPRSPVGCH